MWNHTSVYWKRVMQQKHNHREINIDDDKSIPWYTRGDTSWSRWDLWGCTEGILAAVKGVDGWPGSRRDRGCTKGRRGVQRSSKGRRRIHRRSRCWATNSRRTVRGCGCSGVWPALGSWAARKTWLKWNWPPIRASASAPPIPGFWNPGIIYRWWYWHRDGIGTDVTNDMQCLLECMIHA